MRRDLKGHGCAVAKDGEIGGLAGLILQIGEDGGDGVELMAVDGLVVSDRFLTRQAELEAAGWRPTAEVNGGRVFRRVAPVQLGMYGGFEKARFLDVELALIAKGAADAAILASRPPDIAAVDGWAYPKEAVGAFGRLAKDDDTLQDILVTLVGDPDRSVRFRTWGVVRELKVQKALPALKSRVGQEAIGFSGFAERMLDETLEALKDIEPMNAATRSDPRGKSIEDLQEQAADLEKKAKELREKIEALKVTSRSGTATKPSTKAASD